jgi:anoctamin-10
MLKKLEHTWYKSPRSYSFFHEIPLGYKILQRFFPSNLKHILIILSLLEELRSYFGESIAIYFKFFDFYTKAMYPFAFFGLSVWLLPVSAFNKFILCAVFNLIWNTIFTEFWKRKSNELCFKWGMFDLELTNRPRPQFQGEPGINPVTGRPELCYPK